MKVTNTKRNIDCISSLAEQMIGNTVINLEAYKVMDNPVDPEVLQEDIDIAAMEDEPFLGYHMSPEQVCLAEQLLSRLMEDVEDGKDCEGIFGDLVASTARSLKKLSTDEIRQCPFLQNVKLKRVYRKSARKPTILIVG